MQRSAQSILFFVLATASSALPGIAQDETRQNGEPVIRVEENQQPPHGELQ